MRIVMTLCVRDEQDVLDAQLAFHLNAGVDHVLVTDTGSTDGTLEILERYRAAGAVTLYFDRSEPYRQGPLVARMARAAAVDCAADWVLHSDADEFWWPRGKSLHEVLDVLPPRYGVVFGLWRPFVARPEDAAPFYERMTVRLAPASALNHPNSIFRPNVKVAHRADPDVRIAAGNHDVVGAPFLRLRGWYPIEILHFPVRGGGQARRKYRAQRAGDTIRQGTGGRRGLEPGSGPIGGSEFDEVAVGDEDLARGLEAGVFVLDTRLRDALRSLSSDADGFLLPGVGEGLVLDAPGVLDDALFAADVGLLGDADLVRTQRRMDVLDQRLTQIERAPLARLDGRLRALASRVRRER